MIVKITGDYLIAKDGKSVSCTTQSQKPYVLCTSDTSQELNRRGLRRVYDVDYSSMPPDINLCDSETVADMFLVFITFSEYRMRIITAIDCEVITHYDTGCLVLMNNVNSELRYGIKKRDTYLSCIVNSDGYVERVVCS